jgi:hypothetical protein
MPDTLTARIVAVYPDRLILRTGDTRRTLRADWTVTRQALALFWARVDVQVTVEGERVERVVAIEQEQR